MTQQINELIAVGEHDRIFPLFSKKDLAERWGKSTAAVNKLSNNRPDFPKSIKIFKSDLRPYYPLCEVERFENEYQKNNNEGFGTGKKLELLVKGEKS